MKTKPCAINLPFTIAFFTGPAASGKDSIIIDLGSLLPPEETDVLLMEGVVNKLCEAYPEYKEMRTLGELLPAQDISAGFKSMLMKSTRENIAKKFIFCGGACRSVLEVRTYLDMLVNRRSNYEIHYFSFRCPRHTCVERDHRRAKADQAAGRPLRADWGPEKAGKRWDNHVKNEPEILSAVKQYPRVKVHDDVDAELPQRKVLDIVWDKLGFANISSLMHP